MKKRKPKKVKIIVTFIDDPNQVYGDCTKYLSNLDLKHRIKSVIEDSGVRNLKIQVIKQTKPKGLVYGGSL